LRVAISVLLSLAFVAALVASLMRENAVSCEVCLVYGSATTCQRASATDRDDAVRSAQSAACTVLGVGGVTEGLRCQNATPTSVRCDDAPDP
jgi:hypothetical protein